MITSKKIHIFMLFVAFLVPSACNTSQKQKPLPQNTNLLSELPAMTPGEQGFDEGRLQAVFSHARQLPYIKSLVVVRNGYLVAQEYFNGNSAEDLNDFRSVTKSVVSLLLGVAIDKGLLRGTGACLGEFLPPLGYQLSAEKAAITFEQLLTMTGGWEWNENTGNDYASWKYSADPVRFVIDRPLVSTPGQTFNYNSGAVHLLSVILTQASELDLFDFAARHVFDPLGVPRMGWETIGSYRNGGAGIRLRPRDMAKLGVLMLQRGTTAGQDILPAAWVDAALTIHVRQTDPWFGMVNYGYLWWLDRERAHDAYYGSGYGGQFLYCIPDLQLVVVTTANYSFGAIEAGQHWQTLLALARDEVVAAIQ